MSKNIMFLVNTYYQLLVALQIKDTFFVKDDCYLVLTNKSKGFDSVSNKLQQMQAFSGICYFDTEKWEDEKIGNKLRILLHGIKGDFLKRATNIDMVFDEIIFYNGDLITFLFVSSLIAKNPKMRINRMEEGLLSYNTVGHDLLIENYSKLERIICFFWRFFKKAHIAYEVQSFYCFRPQLYHLFLECLEIPALSSDSNATKIFCKCFNISNKDIPAEKYYFFSSVYDFEGEEPINEAGVVAEIANIVGKDKLIVKTHPRDCRDYYASHGYKVFPHSNVPWEAYLLQSQISNKVFFTATSGGVLSGYLLSDCCYHSYFLYHMCNIDGNTLAANSVEAINELIKEDTMFFGKVCVPRDRCEFIERLKDE